MKCFFVLLTILLLSLSWSTIKCEKNSDNTVSYIKGSLPNQIYRCIQRFNLLRCLKFFVLLRMEARDYSFTSTNSTINILESIIKNENALSKEIPENITSLNDEQLDERLTDGFQKFFQNRNIKLHFISNTLIKIVPSRSNDLEIAIKKFTNENANARQSRKMKEEGEEELDSDDYDDEPNESTKDEPHDTKKDENEKGNGLRKKHGNYLQLGFPVLLVPYMVFAGFLPMLLPVLKLATAFTTIINVTALIASIVYLSRQHAIEREMQQTVYFNPGYKE